MKVVETLGRNGALLFALRLWLRAVRFQNLLTIVCFHRVSPAECPHYPALHPRAFSDLLTFFRRHYDVLAARQVRDNTRSPKPRLLITFDDGYRDFLDHALPALQAVGLPAVMNVVTEVLDSGRAFPWLAFMNAIERMKASERDGLAAELQIPSPTRFSTAEAWGVAFTRAFQELDSPSVSRLIRRHLGAEDYTRTPMLSWSDLRALGNQGITVGSHGHTHQSLDRLPIEDARSELGLSRRRLTAEMGDSIDVVAFPSGRYNTRVVDAAISAGYRLPLGVGVGLNRGGARVLSRTLVYGKSLRRLLLRASGLTETVTAIVRR